MSNKNTIIDPITGKEIDNTGKTDINNTGTTRNQIINPFTGAKIADNKLEEGLESGTETGIKSSFKDFSTLVNQKPDEEISQAYERRAEAQPAFDQALNGMGKAVVTFGGALAENTLGIPFGVVSALAGKGYQNNIIGQSVDALNAMAQENLPNYQTKEEQETIMGSISNPANFFFDKVLNGAAYSAAGMVSMMLPGGIAKLPSMLARGVGKLAIKRTAMNVAKNVATGSRNLGKAAEYGVKGFSGALAESSVESRETQKELRISLADDLGRRKQEQSLIDGSSPEITQKEYDEIEKLSLEGGTANFRLNMLMVGGTQMLTFGNLMRGASQDGYKALAKKIIQKDGKYIKEVLTNKQNLKKGALALGGDSAGEALQEGGQFASNIAINDFYLKSFENPKNADFYESVSKALEETVGSKEGRESMLIGAIVGGGMTAMSKAGESYQEKQLKKKGKLSNEDKAIQKILDIKNSKSFQDISKAVENNNRVLQYNNDLQAAIMENDEAGIQKASFNLLKSDLYTHLAQGTEEVYIEKLNELKELDEKAFKEYFNMQDVQDPIDVNQFADDMIAKTQKAITIYKNIDFLYDSNASGIQKLAQNLGQDELKIRDYLKGNLYSSLTDHDYMVNREDKLGKEIQEETNNVVTYLENRNNGGYIQATLNQAQESLTSEQEVTFRNLLKSSTKTKKLINDALKTSRSRFTNAEDFIDKIGKPNSRFTKKQKGVINALAALKNSSLNPIKQKELQNKIVELQDLAIKRELNDELINNLEGELKGNSNPEFVNKIKKDIDNLNKNIKDAIVKQAEEEVVESESASTKAASTEDSKTEEEVEKIKKKKSNTINNESSTLDLGKNNNLENVIPYMQKRYTNKDTGPALWKKEKDEILSILSEANTFDVEIASNDGIDFFMDSLSELQTDTETLEKLASFYKKNDASKETPKSPIVEINQPMPTDVDSDPSLDTYSDPDDSSVKGSLNLQDDEVVMAAPTLDRLEGTNYPSVFNDNIAKLNNPQVGEKGTKVFIDYKNNTYNQGNKNPRLFAYILDKEGTRIDIGLVSRGYKNNPSVLGKQIFEQIKPSQIGESSIDLNLTVERKNYSKFNSNKGKMINPLKIESIEIDSIPKLAIAIQDAGTMTLFNRGIKVTADVKASKLKEGHTYMYIETPQKNSKGDSIFYAAELKTTKVIELDPAYGEDIVNLLLEDTKKQGSKPENHTKVNDQIFLNYDINGDTINIYSYSEKSADEKGRKPKVLKIDRTNPEDVNNLRNFINNAVVKVDIKKINNPNYNRKIANEGRIKIDLDPVVPIYDTHFVVKQNKVDTSEEATDILPWDDFIQDTEPTIKEDVVNDSQEVNQSEIDKIEKRREEELNILSVTDIIELFSKIDIISKPIGKDFGTQQSMLNAYWNLVGNKYNKGILNLGSIGQVLKTGRYTDENLRQAFSSLIKNDYILDQLFEAIDKGWKIEGSSPDFQIKEINAKYDEELKEFRVNRSKSTFDKQEPLPSKGTSSEGLSFLPKLKTKASNTESNASKKDNESEIAYVKRMIPNTPVNTQVDLARIAKQGSNAAGMFLNGVIYLEKNFQKGVAFHEAFHAVYNSYFTEKERLELYALAQATYGSFEFSDKAKLKKLYPTLNDSQLEDIWLEEQLADEFEKYMLGFQDKSLSQKIKDYFKRLLNAIRGVTTNKSKMDEVFRNISNGKYGKRPINYRFNNVPMLSQRLQGFNSYQTLEAVELVHQTFNHLLKVKTKQKLDNEGVELTEVEAITIFNQNNKLYHKVYDIMKTEYDSTPEGPQREFLRKLMLNFYGDTNDVMGDLVKNHKLYYKVYNYVEINDRVLAINEELDIKDILEELDEIPDFLMPVIEKNSKDKLSQKVKKVLFNLQTDKPNILGTPKLTNFDSLDNTLQEKLSGMMHSDEMYLRLEEESKFYFELKSLINQLKEDPALQAQFFSHYSMGQDKVLQIVNEEVIEKINGKEVTVLKNYLIDTSSKQVRKEILSNWESNLVASDLFNDEGKINLENAKKYLNSYIKEVNNIKSKSILVKSDLDNLSDVLMNLYQVPLTSKELFDKFNSYDNKAQFDNFLSDKGQMFGILESFSKNKNVFISASASENLALNSIVKAIRDSRLEYFQSSIMNGEGKQEYTYRVPAYLHKATSLFNSKEGANYVNRIYGDDKSFDNSLLLNQIKIGRDINVRKVDSIQLQDETTGTRFKNYNALKYQTVNLQSYINQEDGKNKKSNKAYYQMAITSDAPVNYFIENDKFTTSESLDNLYNIYLFEKERMDTVANIKNYNSKEFILLPFMNNVPNLESLKPSEIIKIINENMETYYSTYKDGLIDSGFAYMVNGELKSDFISEEYTNSAKYKSLEEVAKEYYYASFFMIAESTTVFAGDPSFAKPDKITGSKITDLNKRLRELTSPAQMLDTSVMGINKDLNNKAQDNSKYTVLIVKDEERNIVKNELYKAISKKFPKVNNPTTQEEVNNNIRLEVLSQDIDNTDGQSIITMERFKNIKLGQGLWSAKMEDAYNKVKQGTQTFEDESIFMNPIKGFHFELIKDESGKVVPIQKKDSEIVLLPSMVKNNPKLQKLQDRLYDEKNPVDMISFVSAIKKGVHNTNTLDDLYMGNPITLNYSFYGIQQPSAEKHIDSKITFGTQFRKILIGSLSGNYNLNGKSISDSEIKKLYESFIIDNVKEDSVNIIEEMGYNYETDEIDYKKLEKLLVKELDNGDLGPEFKEYLELNDAGNGFKMELWNPIHSHRIEALLQSLVKNRVTKQNIKGGTFVNGTNLMVEGNSNIKPSIEGKDDLQVVMGRIKIDKEKILTEEGKVIFDEIYNKYDKLISPLLKATSSEESKAKVKALREKEEAEMLEKIPEAKDAYSEPYIEHFEVVLPAWSKDIMSQYMNTDGSIKDDMPNELRELVGYRIPTESKYSMTKVYVKAFTPQAMGSTIFMPTEIIAIAGLDFDIDKMFFMIPEHKTTYTTSTINSAYSYIRNNDIGRQTMILELLNITEDEFVDDNFKAFNNADFKKLKETYIENILFSPFDIENNNRDNYNSQFNTKEVSSIEYIKPNYDDVSKNNKKQRNNGIIAIAKSILSAPQSLNEQTNPGSFANLQIHRDDILKLTGRAKNLPSFAAPDVQQELFERTRDASALIGVFANNVASNNMLQYESLLLDKPFEFLGQNIYVLDEKGNLEITRSLSTLVAASVDAVKDPVFKDLNITKFTGNILASMIRLGVNELDAIKILNNRKVIKLAEEIAKLKFQKPSDINAIIDTLKSNVESKAILKSLTDLNNAVDVNKTTEALDDLALNTFKKFYGLSQDINKLTRTTKIDANPPGTIMADNEVTFRNVKEIKDGLSSFEDTSKIFNTNKTNYPLINEFFKATYLEPTNKVFKKLFPWHSPNFDKSKTDILSHLTEKDLSSKQINNINYELLTYFASEEGNMLLSVEKRQELQTKFWKQLNNFKGNNKNKYLILDMLDYDTKEKVIKFKNTTKTSSYKITELKDSWYDLYIDLQNTKDENIAVDLFKYNFMINGFNYNNRSFTHLAPKMMFTDILNIDRINNLIEKGETKAFVNSYIMNKYKTLSLPQLKKGDPGVDKNNYRVDTNKKVYYFLGNENLPNVEKEYGEQQVTYFPKFIKSDDNSTLYMRRGPDEIVGSNPKAEYFAVRQLGSKFSTEYKLNDDTFMTSVKANYLRRGDKIVDGEIDTKPIASANIEKLYSDIIQDNNLQSDIEINIRDNNSDVFDPMTIEEELNIQQQNELENILVDKEVVDRITKSYPDVLKLNDYTFNSKELQNIKYSLFEDEMFSKEDNITIRDQRDFKNDYLKEYGMSDKAYSFAKKSESIIMDLLNATKYKDNIYVNSITDAINIILKENEILTDINQGNLFEESVVKPYSIQTIINSVINELETAEYLTEKQKEYYKKQLEDNPTREGYIKFKKQFCK